MRPALANVVRTGTKTVSSELARRSAMVQINLVDSRSLTREEWRPLR